MTCCYLFPVIYSKLKDESTKKELLQVYYDITHEEPSAWRAATDNIKNFCEVNEKEGINLLIKLYNEFIVDYVDIVKIYTIQSRKKLLNKIKPDEKNANGQNVRE